MKFTDETVKQFKKMMKDDGKDSIKIFAIKSCCSTMLMIGADKGKPGDKLVKIEDVNIFIDPETNDALSNAEIDCAEGEFKIKGLQESGSSCCG